MANVGSISLPCCHAFLALFATVTRLMHGECCQPVERRRSIPRSSPVIPRHLVASLRTPPTHARSDARTHAVTRPSDVRTCGNRCAPVVTVVRCGAMPQCDVRGDKTGTSDRQSRSYDASPPPPDHLSLCWPCSMQLQC